MNDHIQLTTIDLTLTRKEANELHWITIAVLSRPKLEKKLAVLFTLLNRELWCELSKHQK